jgi:hypothetical protein
MSRDGSILHPYRSIPFNSSITAGHELTVSNLKKKKKKKGKRKGFDDFERLESYRPARPTTISNPNSFTRYFKKQGRVIVCQVYFQFSLTLRVAQSFMAQR